MTHDLPALFSAAVAPATIIDNDTGAISSVWTFSMKEPINPSTPIQECLRDCTATERASIAAGTPPYDGVRTWGDLEAVRAQEKPIAAKVKVDDDHA